MRKRIIAYILVGLLLMSFTIPQASAGTLSGYTNVHVTSRDAQPRADFVGFINDPPPNNYTLDWHPAMPNTIDVGINIHVDKDMDPETETDWKAEIVITLTLEVWPFTTVSSLWRSGDWPDYTTWDEDSDDIEDDLQMANPPAAIQGQSWEYKIEVKSWWIGEETDSQTDTRIGIINVS